MSSKAADDDAVASEDSDEDKPLTMLCHPRARAPATPQQLEEPSSSKATAVVDLKRDMPGAVASAEVRAGNNIQLIEAAPSSRTSKTLKELSHGIVIKTILTVEHDTLERFVHATAKHANP